MMCAIICIISIFLIFLFFKLRFFVKPKDLSNEIILVTGAGNGIGRLLCIELAKYCNNIIAWDIDEVSLGETADIVLNQIGVKIEYQRCDVSCQKEIASCASELRRKFGTVTVLVNNAGVVNGKFLLELNIEELERIFKINVFASIYTVQEFLPDMIGFDIHSRIPSPLRRKESEMCQQDIDLNRKPHGHIVFTSSIAGVMPGCGLSDYCASKAALSMLSDCLEMELTKLKLNRNIILTEIRPYAIDTGMFSGCKFNLEFLLPILKKENVARRIVDAIRFNESVVYVPGWIAIMPIIKHVFPKWLLRIAHNTLGSTTFMDSFDPSRIKKSQ